MSESELEKYLKSIVKYENLSTIKKINELYNTTVLNVSDISKLDTIFSNL